MGMKRILLYSYLFLALFVLFVSSTTTLTFLQLFPALLQLAFCYWLFVWGFDTRTRYQRTGSASILKTIRVRPEVPTALYVGAGAVVLAASVLAAFYYTGKTPSEVFSYLGSDRSLYASYQEHNRMLLAAGGTGWMNPYFMFLVYVKVVLLASILSIIPRGDPIRTREVLLLVSACAAQAYLGLARGTGLEFFQMGSLLIFAMLMRPRLARRGAVRGIVLFTVVALAFLYSSLLSARGVTALSLESGGDVRLDPEGLGYVLGDSTVSFFLTFYDYFGFGFHYVASYWSDIWLTSWTNMLAGMLPLGYGSVGLDPLALMPQVVVMGPRWHPDSVQIMASIGFVGLMVVSVILGRVSRVLEHKGSLASAVLLYYAFLQMLSLPVGNFVWIDVTNVVIIVFLSVILVLRSVGLLAPTFFQFFGLSGSHVRRVHSTRISSEDLRNRSAPYGLGAQGEGDLR